MTKEEKLLLVEAIHEYLPYEPILSNENISSGLPQRVWPGYLGLKSYIEGYTLYREEDTWQPINFTKIYLRPMSSMTEDEKKELLAVVDSETKDIIDQLKTGNCGIMEGKYHFNSLKELDWLKRHFFDYRGLIEMGLALPVPNNMYNIEEK